MKAKELRNKNADELQKELLSLRKAQFGLRMQLATQQTTNVSEARKLRRDVARIKTILTEKARQA
jgi:large subunit ribosomal protein L29